VARSKHPGQTRSDGGLPTREEILKFLTQAQKKTGKREIARAFGIKGGARIALKRLLSEMAAEGSLAGNRKDFREKGKIAPVAVLEVTGRDEEGDLIARPVVWNAADGERPMVLLLLKSREPASEETQIGVGDKVLSRVTRLDHDDIEGYRYEAEPIRKLPRDARRMLGIFRTRKGGGGTIEPIERKALRSWQVPKGQEANAADGDLVRFDLGRNARQSSSEARVLESLGNPEDQRKISLIAVHAHGIPDEFPESVIQEAQRLKEATLEARADLRHIPLITIDPIDARDHDDAVFAEPDIDPANKGGFIAFVAIADVAHYVRPGSRLDREAQLRGNSVYFPDRVVPMLPEKISNDLCSLREGEERACLAVRLVFDRHGEKRNHSFMRGLMRSAAKLSYQEAQAAIDGDVSEKCAPLMEAVLRPLWTAYKAIAKARDAREPLDLDLPERKILLDKNGRVARVITPERLEAHRLIEEFMIQANVAAAEMLEARKVPVVYRVHDRPSKEKLKSLSDFLTSLDLKIPPVGSLTPAAFNKVLAKAKDLPVPDLVNEVVLRAQAQAEYSTENIGHFGLNLSRYAHFTSPIRRYADLLVHRALVRALRLGDGALEDHEVLRLADISRAISEAERRAMAAERETADRLIATHLADRVGATFEGRVAGVTRSGLFVKLNETGADGFVPVSTLGRDYYEHDETLHALVGSRTGEAYRLGDRVSVRLVEAIPTAGALRFEMLTEGKRMSARPIRGLKGRHAPRRRGRFSS
jgi:ribonuclease R